MKTLENDQDSIRTLESARRAKRIILWVMAIFILLPFVLIWLTGAFAF